MAASHDRAQREADPSGVSLFSFSASSGAEGVVVLDAVINDDFVHRFQAYDLHYVKALAQFRRADELDAEAAYCDHRASGPGYYVDLLRGVAADRVVMGAAAPDRERGDVVSAAESARRRRRRVPALCAGPVTPPRPRSTRWRWHSGWGRSWRTCIWPTAAVPPATSTGARSGQPARCRRVPGGGPRVQLARGVLEVSTRRVRTRGLCASGGSRDIPGQPRRRPDRRAQDRVSGKPPTSSAADASLSCRRTCSAEQIDLPQPRSEGPPT